MEGIGRAEFDVGQGRLTLFDSTGKVGLVYNKPYFCDFGRRGIAVETQWNTINSELIVS